MTDIYEPRCPDCGRFDANCKCDWPMPSSAPTTPPGDEAKAEPEVEIADAIEQGLRDRGMLA